MSTGNPITLTANPETNTLVINGLQPNQLIELRAQWERKRFFHSEIIEETSLRYQFTGTYGFIQGYKMAVEYIGMISDVFSVM